MVFEMSRTENPTYKSLLEQIDRRPIWTHEVFRKKDKYLKLGMLTKCSAHFLPRVKKVLRQTLTNILHSFTIHGVYEKLFDEFLKFIFNSF